MRATYSLHSKFKPAVDVCIKRACRLTFDAEYFYSGLAMPSGLLPITRPAPEFAVEILPRVCNKAKRQVRLQRTPPAGNGRSNALRILPLVRGTGRTRSRSPMYCARGGWKSPVSLLKYCLLSAIGVKREVRVQRTTPEVGRIR